MNAKPETVQLQVQREEWQMKVEVTEQICEHESQVASPLDASASAVLGAKVANPEGSFSDGSVATPPGPLKPKTAVQTHGARILSLLGKLKVEPVEIPAIDQTGISAQLNSPLSVPGAHSSTSPSTPSKSTTTSYSTYSTHLKSMIPQSLTYVTVKAGQLEKKTQNSIMGGWRRRWFVLSEDATLLYFHNEPGSDSIPVASLKLVNKKGVEAAITSTGQEMTITAGKYSWKLKSHPATINEWVVAAREQIAEVQNRRSDHTDCLTEHSESPSGNFDVSSHGESESQATDRSSIRGSDSENAEKQHACDVNTHSEKLASLDRSLSGKSTSSGSSIIISGAPGSKLVDCDGTCWDRTNFGQRQ